MGERFRRLVPARELASEPPQPRVELLVVDKGADWDEDDSLARPWRLAEARVLAGRLVELIRVEGCAAGEIVLLTRATTDLRVYERALEAAGVPTYVIGGRGYWGHPQVLQVVAYLRALANPLDQEALYATLLSPLGGALSLDGLVLYASRADMEELAEADREALERFWGWFEGERIAAARLGAEELIDRVLAVSGYELALLRLPDGRRRLANVRKLMRLAREWEAEGGSDLAGFIDLLGRLRSGGADRESEAPMETEGLDAVRLMTIHRAKGLEFPVVCVADLGRGPTYGRDLLRLSRDGRRLGLMLARPGLARNLRTPTYAELSDLQWTAEQEEERRLFYVAMTRARERLILSGAMKQAASGAGGGGSGSGGGGSASGGGGSGSGGGGSASGRIGSGSGRGGSGTPADWLVPVLRDLPGVRYSWISADSEHVKRNNSGKHTQSGESRECASASGPVSVPAPAAAPTSVAPQPPPPLGTLSYSAIHQHARCGYRFYVERVLGIPPVEQPIPGDGPGRGPTGIVARDGRQLGNEVHQLLQTVDFRRPVIPSGLSAEVTGLLRAFVDSDMRLRLAAANEIRREQRFAFPFEGTLLAGIFDVLAVEAQDRLLVVDYKTDRLNGLSPAALAADEYGIQRLIYAIAALRHAAAVTAPVDLSAPRSAAGVPERVEVVHLFLDATAAPASATYEAADLPGLERELAAASRDLREGIFEVAANPGRSLCHGCPARGGLCSWPAELTYRT
jgi:ATP-dependent helicase/nuclease subunit A